MAGFAMLSGPSAARKIFMDNANLSVYIDVYKTGEPDAGYLGIPTLPALR
jgi:hypothetical protein